MKLKKEFTESSQKQVSSGEERKEGRKDDSSFSRTPDRSHEKGRIGVDHRSKDIKKDKKKKKKHKKDKHRRKEERGSRF